MFPKKFFMRMVSLLIASLFIFQFLKSQDSLSSISELQILLKQRKDHFQEYAAAADKRSGIFGTKTKKDLEQSREILLGIVTLDNRIMERLNSVIAARGMARADNSSQLMENQQTI